MEKEEKTLVKPAEHTGQVILINDKIRIYYESTILTKD